ncbi:TPA: shufflon system plasmid conjugative transfer pilus tip adhesin PilV [Pseudomonas aeruginosa]|nr:shufflon system plasmid conjugative transfer pilus tip adhesin PilV [Pseudomonas aeruginosa]
MTYILNKRQKGLTLFETLLSLSIVMSLVIGFLYWYLEQQREQQATIFGKDIVSIITAFDKRIHLDGWDIDNFKNGREWSGSPAILEMLNNEFIAKDSTCGNPKSWVPVLSKEKSTQLLPCKFWSKVPYDFIAKAKITPDEEGFIKNYKVIFQPKNLKSFSENFRYYNRAKIAANANDSLNVTGGHQFYFAALSDPATKITNTECLALKADCTFVATYDREGGNEYLRVDGTNSMLGSAVAFKESKGHNRLRCIKWIKDTSSGSWTSKNVDCGIGIHTETGAPVAVDIAVNSSTNQRVMLDRLCPVFTHSANSLIDSTQKAPCGILPQDDAGTEVAYQVIDTLSAGKGLIKTLYTDTIFSDEINTNYMNVKKDLAVLGNSKMDGTLTVKGRAQFDNNINLTKVEAAGGVCSPNGLLARDSKGLILSCESGIWVTQSTTGMYAFFNSTTCPPGWLAANGSGGTIDLRGQFVRAWDNGKGVDPGRALASAQQDDLKSHKHNATASMDGLHSHLSRFTRDRSPTEAGNAVLGDENYYGEQLQMSEPAGLHTHTITVNNFGGTETRPKNMALLACMKK